MLPGGASRALGRVMAKERILELFVVRDGAVPDGTQFQIIAQSPSGNATGTATLPRDLHRDVLELQQALLRGPLSRRGQTVSLFGAEADEKMIGELGAKLHSFLFAGDIANFYKRSLADASNAQEALRIKLRISDTSLAAVPWEALYDPKNRIFLSAELRPTFTRAVESDALNLWCPKKLQILGMISGPATFDGYQLPSLDVDAERVKMESCLDSLKSAGKATLSWTNSGSYRDFRRRLREPESGAEGWTVFHFIGHGDFNENEKQGYLIFEESGGSAGEARYPDTLGPLLTDTGGPQLVVLNSCNGARSGSGDIFSSTAAALALAGVPAVIAMQFPVSDKMAITFSSLFYEYLADYYSVQKALAQTRIDLKGQRISEWISPVLFMQSIDGRLLAL
jgi:hypothetical protein